jgi:predicted Zn-dependent protease
VTEKKDTLYCMPGAAGDRSFRRLTGLCRRVALTAAYTRADLEGHKALLPEAFPAWLASGQAWEEAGEPGAALGEYEQILQFSPDNIWALVRIADLLRRSGDASGAALYLRRARRLVTRSTMLKRMAGTARKSA